MRNHNHLAHAKDAALPSRHADKTASRRNNARLCSTGHIKARGNATDSQPSRSQFWSSDFSGQTLRSIADAFQHRFHANLLARIEPIPLRLARFLCGLDNRLRLQLGTNQK
jgi:hypothetical protein